MPPTNAPKLVLVKSTSPRGSFRRAGLTFTSEWRPLEVGTVVDLEKGRIDTRILGVLEREAMLAVKPAAEVDVERYLEALRETAGKDPVEENAALRKQNADLEGRLMRLELAVGTKNDNGELAAVRKENAELRARLEKLEKASAEKPAAEKAPADKSDKK